MKKRSGLQVMAGLIGRIKPLIVIMVIAIVMGCIGNLAAIFITILGGYGLLTAMGLYSEMFLSSLFVMILILVVLKVILRYAEQIANHYIAFKLLARIRHQVFASLRKLAPAKLEGSEKGNLVSIITSDIELLEVFYAHTISPIVIAFIISVIMSIFIGQAHFVLGLIAMFFYFTVGVLIPVVNSRRGRAKGQSYRNKFGELNTVVLDNLYGLEEILQYQQSDKRMKVMADQTNELNEISSALKKDETRQRVMTDSVILVAGVIVALVSGYLVQADYMTFSQMVIAIIAMMSSFGPVAALSALSNNLNQTLASGDRVLNILKEEPIVEDVIGKNDSCKGTVMCKNITFAYPDMDSQEERILQNLDVKFEENKIHGVLGESGCGKSTSLKLLMRFYETDSGEILYGNHSVNEINTNYLRKRISYVTQDTFLFQDSIENNIKIAKEDATREEVVEAAKKASIHSFIESLTKGYDTLLGELGDSISGGEKQRLGIARAFLHGSNFIFMDEPTSNLDSLNEGIILKSLKREKQDKTIIMVSHRKSTMGIADKVIKM